jgi:predicted RNase H-like HicB family nuclease
LIYDEVMRVMLQAQFHLFGLLKKENGWYIAHCPPLDITTQGRTEAEAKRNLAEASELFVVSCFERGTFEQALRELGWSVVAGRPAARRGKRSVIPRKGSFRFPVPVPFGFEKADATPKSASLAQTSLRV